MKGLFMRIVFLLCCMPMVLLSCVDPVRPVSRNFDRVACNPNATGVTIDELEEVTEENVGEYQLSGECDRDQSEVLVNIEGNPLVRYPICMQGKWEVSADISGLVNKKERFQIAVSQGSANRNMLCENVRNYFICPNNYIAISDLPYIDGHSFCVMKYEAKVKSGTPIPTRLGENILVKAEALANGDLITRVTEETAIQFCKQNGPGYDLIHNDEWQLIAHHIERTPDNWSHNTRDITSGNRLNIGYVGSGAVSKSNTDEEQSNWDLNKRVHQLANQEYIWDFAGNLWEIVRHDITDLPGGETYTGFVNDMPSAYQNDFGPERDYSVFNSRERTNLFGGLGYMLANEWGGAIIRGGSNQWRINGIFSTNVMLSGDRLRRIDIGFRCVYYP